MCASLNTVKNQTLSQATFGDCTISDDCLKLQCSYVITNLGGPYNGFPVSINKTMTLLPCTTPYSFGLVVSSTFLGGDLVNGVFSESSDVGFYIASLGISGTVAIIVVQQEFGLTITVSSCKLV